ncbi:hypothetical protein LIER_08614 [Lithospermum erythrorhizon]|uniref:Maturase K n=1 Tax=Lithospermum erythrorhizon TaxID=34254 RepID=A0AAV3PCV2_LITER
MEINKSSGFSLARHLMEAILSGLAVAKRKRFHRFYIITDHIFSQVWLRIYNRLSKDQGWLKEIDSLQSCSILWFPTDFGCFKNLHVVQSPGFSTDQIRQGCSSRISSNPSSSNAMNFPFENLLDRRKQYKRVNNNQSLNSRIPHIKIHFEPSII